LRYEEMVQDTPRELAKIASFLGVDAGRDQLLRAAERSSADNMRKLEKAQAQSFSATRGTRQDIPFVRAAASGGWQSTLPADCVAGIEDAWGNLMQWLGYNLAFRQKAGADSNVLGSLLGLRTG
jgi:Sulfotransferase domain